MFNFLSHTDLQQLWWIIITLVGSILVFLLFVQGGQTLFNSLSKKEEEKTMIINSIGRKWEFTFTTLVLFAAGMFASFPLFYTTTFGGAYFAWKLFIISFVLQAISFEFRRKKGNIFGSKTFESFLVINGILGTFLLGAAVATFFTGSEFYRSEYNLTTWQSSLYGIEILFNFTNISLGLAVLFLARILGSMYITNNVEHKEIRVRSKKQLGINSILFLVFFLYFIFKVLTMKGFAVNPETSEVFMQDYKYLNNFLEMPISLILFLLGVILVLYGIFINYFKNSIKGIWFSGLGTVLTVFALFLIVGFNNTSFYPSTFDIQSSLTIYNASSSKYSLSIMTFAALLVPIVLTYIFFTWKSIDKTKITAEDINDNNSHHVY